MRTKKVSRYWCDFCNKAGLRSHSMVRHELRCTKNPNRVCGACHLTGDGGHSHTPMELAALLPKPFDHSDYECTGGDHYAKWKELADTAFIALREASGNCPACIMSAIRLSGNDVPAFEDFDFKEEMQELFKIANEERRAMVGGYY